MQNDTPLLTRVLFQLSQQAMVGTGEALLNVRARGGQAGQAGATRAIAATSSEEFDFQGELQKFDKVLMINFGLTIGFLPSCFCGGCCRCRCQSVCEASVCF